MAFTALLVMNDALAIVGNTNPTGDEYAQATRTLSNILATISTEDFAVISSTQDSLTLVDGTTSYSYGTGGDLNSSRPVKITSMYINDTSGDSSPIDMITEVEYNDVVDKDSTGFPNRVFYKPDFPLGSLKLVPTPNDAYVLKINAQKRVATVTAKSDSLTLPDEYIEYLIAKLVIRIGRFYGYAPTREDYLIVAQTEGDVKTVNSDNHITVKPTLTVSALGRGRRPISTVNWEE
jgi:hypothetical protein